MKEYNFTSRETGISCSIIELFRNGYFEYYVLTEFSADLYFCFGVHDQFTEHQLYTLIILSSAQKWRIADYVRFT